MPNIHDMVPSTNKYIRKEDLTQPRLVTIANVTTENVALSGQPDEIKGILVFQEADLKPLILNQTNTNVLIALFGEMTENWLGKQLIAYNDLTVQYQGNVGGVRLRQPDNVAMQPAQPTLQPGSQPVNTQAVNPVQTNNPATKSPNQAAPDFKDDVPW